MLRVRVGGFGVESDVGIGSGLGGSEASFNRRFFSSRSCFDKNISGVRMISRAFSDDWRFVKRMLSFPPSFQFSKFSIFRVATAKDSLSSVDF